MSTVTLDVQLNMTGTEQLTAAEAPTAASATARALSLGGLNVSATLDATTTPPVSATPCFKVVTISGTTTIDLTAATAPALPASASRTVDLSGKKLVAYAFKANATNAGGVTISVGGTNGYALFGASKSVILQPGESMFGVIGTTSTKPAVGASAKTIDITGTTNDVVTLVLYFG